MGRGAADVLNVHGEGTTVRGAIVGDVGELLAVGADRGREDIPAGGELGAVAECEAGFARGGGLAPHGEGTGECRKESGNADTDEQSAL